MNFLIKQALLSKNILYIESVKAPDALEYSEMIKGNCGLVGAVLRSLGSLGYTLDRESVLRIATLKPVVLKDFYDEAFDFLADVTGMAHNVHTVLFEEFPNVSNLSAEDMFFRQLVHYFASALSDMTGFDKTPMTTGRVVSQKLPFDEKVQPKVLKLKTAVDQEEVEQVLASYFKNYLSASVAVPNVKKDTLEQIYTLFAFRGKETALMPDAIPFKENVVYLFGLLQKRHGLVENIFKKLLNNELAFPFMKTITDYLRLYTFLSSNTYMIKENVKYKTFSRKIRKWFLRELNDLCQVKARCAEFASHRQEWIYVFENLHPGDYAAKYPFVYKAASDLRSDNLRTFNSKVEQAFVDGNTTELVRLLSQRPGLYARSLDRALRNDRIGSREVIDGFSAIANQIATPVLLQLYTYYLRRTDNSGPRVFVIKNEHNTTIHGIKDERQLLKASDINLITKTLAQALIDRQSAKTNEEIDGMKVWLDESMKHYTVPANNRGASNNERAIPSGSYIEFTPDKDVLRLFTHWHNINDDDEYFRGGRVDIDLSCIVLDDNFNQLCEYSWRSYHTNNKIGMSFSGDVTSAPHGANEFIDIKYKELLSKLPGSRYVVICNNVFTGQPFNRIPECFSGIMFREKLGTLGEVFEPSTIATKFDLQQPGTNMNIAAVVDLVNMRLYYIDQGTSTRSAVAGTQFTVISNMVRNVIAPSVTMYDLVKIAAKSKKFTLTRKPERANFVISDNEEAQLRPWDQELFAKIFM